jgi:hypothetical protein
MLDASDKWYTNVDSWLINAILFIDLNKAYGTFDHNILLLLTEFNLLWL